VQFGDKPIKNLYDFTDALRRSKVGDVVEVKVLRDGQPVTGVGSSSNSANRQAHREPGESLRWHSPLCTNALSGTPKPQLSPSRVS